MIVLLHHDGDREAIALARALVREGAGPVTPVSLEALVMAPKLSLGMGARVRARATLADGRRIDSLKTRALINRSVDLPPVAYSRSTNDDRAYTDSEWRAVLAGWISAFPRVLNRPAGMSLGGPSLHPLAWEAAAAAAGLTVAGQMLSELADPEPHTPLTIRNLVVGRHVLGKTVPGILPEALRALAHFTGHDVLEVVHGMGPEGPVFVRADARPALSPYSGATRALVRTLTPAAKGIHA